MFYCERKITKKLWKPQNSFRLNMLFIIKRGVFAKSKLQICFFCSTFAPQYEYNQSDERLDAAVCHEHGRVALPAICLHAGTDFRKLRPVMWHWVVCLFQLLIIAVLMALILHFKLTTDKLIVMEAVLMCVVAPCASAAAVVTQKLGGSLEQMTTYTFISNFMTALLVPVCFPLIEPSADMSFLSAFAKILYEVVVVLLVPMLLAYIVKHHLHRLHHKIINVKDLSYYLWACSLMIVTGTTVKNIVHAQAGVALIGAIALLGLLLCIIQFAVGRFIGHYFNHTQEAGQALGQKNTAFAIWMAYTYLNPLSSVGPGCYILWQNIINSVEIWQKRKSEQGELSA